MSTQTIRIRVAEPADANGVAAVHDCAWPEAYRGIIPGPQLEQMVQRRGAKWWQNALMRGSRLAVFDFDGAIAGYASYGRNRAVSLPYKGEIFELYLKPEFQGLGFGKRLFSAAQRELAHHGLGTSVVWCLADNERAIAFYEAQGGLLIGRAHELFGDKKLERLAYGWR